MNNEELDSQLSAMFDDELPEPECELLARRLARDEGLKARWGRYAVIGACIRMERGSQEAADSAPHAPGRQPDAGDARMPLVRLHGALASRVSRLIAEEPALLSGPGAKRGARGLAHSGVGRWWQPAAGGAVVAAGVAAAAILWLRTGSPDAPLVMQTVSGPGAPLIAPAHVLPVAMASSSAAASAARDRTAAPPDAESYVVPPPARSPSIALPVELANFVVAHSEYSMPLLRRNVLSELVADESGADSPGDVAADPSAASGASSGAQDSSADETATDAPGPPGAAARGSRPAGASSGTPHAPHADYAR